MLSSELEYCLNDAFQRARDERHEFITVEHLLLALLDTPHRHRHVESVRHGPRAPTARAEGIHRGFHAAAARRGRRGHRSAADAGFPARAAARRLSRPIERPQRGHSDQRARRDFRREAIAGRLFTGIAGRDAARRRELHFARRAEGAGSQQSRSGRRRCRRRAAGRIESARALHDEPQCTGRGGQDRSADRAAARGRANRADTLSTPQEQSVVRRRGWGREDGARRRARTPHHRGQGAGHPASVHDLRARHGRAHRRHEIPRRFREAAEGRRRRSQEAPRSDSFHRRDPHRNRCRRGVGRRHGRVESHQAAARERRAALHRLYDVHRVPRYFREGSRAGAALPENRRRRAVSCGDHRDPAGPEDPLRGASQHRVLRRSVAGRCGAVGQTHQRSASAR